MLVLRTLFCAVLLAGLLHQPAHSANLDSLRKLILRGIADTTTVKVLNEYAMAIHETYPDSTRLFATRAIAIADALHYLSGKALSLNTLGVSYFIQNNYEKALENYLLALALREKIVDMKGVAGTLNNVGMVYRDMKEYSTALSYYFRALRLNDSLKNTTFYVRNLNNIGVAYESLNLYDSALVYHRRSIEMKRSIADKAGVASSLRNIGKVFLKMKRYNEALATFQEGLAIREIGKQVRAMILLDMALVYEETEELGAAMKSTNEAMTLAHEMGVALIQQNAHELLARLYQRVRDHQNALVHYQRFITIRDSLFNENSSRRLAALQTNYEIDRQRAQIELLTKETELQNTVRNGLIAGVILVFSLLIVSVIAYRNKRRSEQDLRTTNTEILRQQDLLEHQAEEIQIANNALSENNIALGSANELLTTLNSEKNDIMGIVAHDLRNPLGAVRGLAELLQSGYVAPSQIPVVTGQIVSASDRMLELVKNLLEVNQLELGGKQFQSLPFAVLPFVQSTIAQYEAAAVAKQIVVHYANPSQDNDTTILADEQAVMQVLDNIISNAIKYSPRGKNVFVRVMSKPPIVRLEVQDEGPGISEEDMKKLFGKFARLSAQPTGGEHSTGLGLSIVKKMVGAMNGKVWCESELGQGATFIVELPRAIT
jgi:signal transduction histidine kinase